MLYFHSWSGGKDSTASIILSHIHKLPVDKIITVEVMFDESRGISGEDPEQIEWIKETAIPRLREWGYDVEILHSDRDFMTMFNWKRTQSKTLEYRDKIQGFPYNQGCYCNSDIKRRAINKFLARYKGQEITQYIGIAADEPERLEKLHARKRNQVSLLEQYGVTEADATALCKQYNLLSPLYKKHKRGGCWFCANQPIKDMAYTKTHRPELWGELERLAEVPNTINRSFRYGKTFQEVNREVDKYLEYERWKQAQISLFGYTL